MNLSDAIISCYRNYFNPRGRASRAEFWYFYLFSILVGIGIVLASILIGTTIASNRTNQGFEDLAIIISAMLFAFIITLGAVGIPLFMVWIRRLHDIGQTGWWMALPFGMQILVLLSGGSFLNVFQVSGGTGISNMGLFSAVANLVQVALLVVAVLPGQPESNAYGAVPGALTRHNGEVPPATFAG